MDPVGRQVVFGKGVHMAATGGAGSLGSHPFANLGSRRCGVMAIDNLATGGMRNMEPLFDRGGLHCADGAHDVVAPTGRGLSL